MEAVIIKPRNEVLEKYIQYFLFFRKSDNSGLNYTTFPNNNLCLAVYRQNAINYINYSETNNCIITNGGRKPVSRFYGFHKRPFQVDINSPLDQFCVVFYPAAIRAFTKASYAELMGSDTVFDEVFTVNDTFVLERIFESNDPVTRAAKLENLLLGNLKDKVPAKLKEALHLISEGNIEHLNVENLSKKLDISDATLYRLFTNHLGQAPKSYLKTVRFRNVLAKLLRHENSFTEIAYSNQYYDQAHFINDFKQFSGYAPRHLLGKISVQQQNLAWIYNK